MDRKPISKKLRFEIFKRDKFQCQYCGRTAPDVVLQVDHIDPVANGGSNDLINLITSCFDCNQGKKATLLSDDTVVQKQRKQLELLQERREQLELMIEWKKHLAGFDTEKVKMISDYWTSLMSPYQLTENGVKKLELLLKSFSIESVLESIDVVKEKYIKYDADGQITKESIETAFNKIGGVCAVKNMSEIDKKISYVKGICKNRFSNWNVRTGSIVLVNYVKSLKEHGLAEEDIVKKIENEIIPKTKEFSNFTQWKNWIEKITDEIVDYVEDKDVKLNLGTLAPIEFNESEFKTFLIQSNEFDVLKYLGKPFSEFDDILLKENLKQDLILMIETEEFDNPADFVYSSRSFSLFCTLKPEHKKLIELKFIVLDFLICFFGFFGSYFKKHSKNDYASFKNIIEDFYQYQKYIP